MCGGRHRLDRIEPDAATEFASSDEALGAGRTEDRSDVGMDSDRATVDTVEGALVEPQHQGHRCIEEGIESTDDVKE